MLKTLVKASLKSNVSAFITLKGWRSNYKFVDNGPPLDVTPPIITSTASHTSVENSGYSSIATANEPVTWTKGGTDASLVSLITSTGVWSVPAQDYETKTTVSFTLTATDTAGNVSVPQTVTLTITDIDDTAPSITSSASPAVNENAAFSHTLTANETVTWSLIGGADQARFTLANNILSMTAKDYEAPIDANADNVYSVQVRATDTAGNSTTQTINVSVLNIDDTTPVITSNANPTVNENVAFSHTLTANETVTWSLVGGADQARFTLVNNILSMTAKDYEIPLDANADNIYVVQVRATDTAGNFSTQTISVFVQDVVEGAGWAMGLSATPSYVPNWTLPASVAAGKSSGAIPSDAIAYETGNSGGQFASMTDWINACNAANVAGALQSDITITTSFSSLQKYYLRRGLYGAAGSNGRAPRIALTGRLSDNTGRKSLFFTHSEDATIQGIEFVDCGCVLATGAKTVALIDSSGVVDTNPYHTGTQPVTTVCDPVLGSAAGFYNMRLGRIITSGSFNVSQLVVKRQIANTTAMGGNSGSANNNHYFSQAAWDAVLETITLFSGQACTTNAQIRDAINANTGTHGYAAVLSVVGDVFIQPTTVDTQPFSELIATATGTVTTDCKAPDVTITHCIFTDCNNVYMALLDVTELGKVEFHKNEMPGTWSGVYAQVTRWRHFRAANNHQWDCLQTNSRGRTQTGRPATGAGMPAGSSLSEFNTCFYLGTDSPVHMRYSVDGDVMLIENNYAHDCESYNNTNTVNAAAFADIRNGWQRTSNGKLQRLAYNRIEHYKGIRGAEDAQAMYLKPRGFTIAANIFIDTGAAWYSTGSVDGSEFSVIGVKEPGPYNGLYTSPYGTNEREEEAHIYGNIFQDMPGGIPPVKIDQKRNVIRLRDLWFKNWVNYRNGVEQVDPTSSGLIRITDTMYQLELSNILIENCYSGPTDPALIINMHNISNSEAVTFTPAAFMFRNIDVKNDGSATYPVETANRQMIRFNFGGNNPASGFVANVPTKDNRILAPNGSDTGFRMIATHTNRSESSVGTNAAASAGGYGSNNYLASYGALL